MNGRLSVMLLTLMGFYLQVSEQNLYERRNALYNRKGFEVNWVCTEKTRKEGEGSMGEGGGTCAVHCNSKSLANPTKLKK